MSQLVLTLVGGPRWSTGRRMTLPGFLRRVGNRQRPLSSLRKKCRRGIQMPRRRQVESAMGVEHAHRANAGADKNHCRCAPGADEIRGTHYILPATRIIVRTGRALLADNAAYAPPVVRQRRVSASGQRTSRREPVRLRVSRTSHVRQDDRDAAALKILPTKRLPSAALKVTTSLFGDDGPRPVGSDAP